MKTDIVIGSAGADRILEVSAFLARCWKAAYKGLVGDDYLVSLKNTHWIEFLETKRGDRTAECLAAESGGQIVGVSVFGKSTTELFPDDGEVICLYVAPEFIGHHVGHTLLERSLQALKEEGYAVCVLDVLAENARAVGFYKSHGFETVVRDQKIRLGKQELPYIIMRKPL